MLQYEPGQKRSARQCRFLTGSSAWLIALTILAVPLAAWSARPIIAEAAPDFALKSLTGANLRLSEYRGEIVIVNFWSTRCGRCRDQLSKLDALYSEHREKALQLLSVNIDKNQDAVREAVASLRLQFPVMLDEQKTVSRLYDLGAMPFTVFIDHAGTVRYIHAGYQRGDEQIYGNEIEILLAE
jgi:peroxiredoxin